ncbi:MULTISPECIES: trp operon leader peptide [Enterobacter cloacae complex]|nr:trp operon leader peptide [Enterobacter hormaechei]HCT8059490.1 trp operon leader peptide [Enterobacter hormaechei]
MTAHFALYGWWRTS